MPDEEQAQQPQGQDMGQILQLAESAESQGIAVDWKAMCLKVFTAANQSVAALNTQIAELTPAAEEEEGK